MDGRICSLSDESYSSKQTPRTCAHGLFERRQARGCHPKIRHVFGACKSREGRVRRMEWRGAAVTAHLPTLGLQRVQVFSSACSRIADRQRAHSRCMQERLLSHKYYCEPHGLRSASARSSVGQSLGKPQVCCSGCPGMLAYSELSLSFSHNQSWCSAQT